MHTSILQKRLDRVLMLMVTMHVLSTTSRSINLAAMYQGMQILHSIAVLRQQGEVVAS